jgi:murein DD-endopeptidase MepM/ murein hydrolase activator NlpD
MNEQQAVLPQADTTGKALAGMSRARVVVYALAAFATVVLVTDPFVTTVSFVYSRVIRDQYELYRMKVENEQLQQANSRMKSELVALKTSHSRTGHLEATLNSKLSSLEDLIDQTTGLGIFKSTKRSRGQVLADKDGARSTPANRGALAAILASPELSTPAREGSYARSKPGVGGAENPCDSEQCRFGATRDDISLTISPSVRSARGQQPIDLDWRFDRLVSIIQHLPIGHPARGDISSGFGRRSSPFTRRLSFHHGVDLSMPRGERVVATGAGVVQRVAYNRTYGTLIDIEHVKGLVTRYAHLAKTIVRPGQKVSRGEVIALSGSSGRSTGPHLHYEVIHNGQARDPEPFMELAARLADIDELTARRG